MAEELGWIVEYLRDVRGLKIIDVYGQFEAKITGCMLI